MGNCCYNNNDHIFRREFAIKFPQTTEYIYYENENNDFVYAADINTFLGNLYCVNHFNNWVIYNDDISKIAENHTKKGHCKGIVSWSKDSIGWLIHSVPNFPRKFKGNSISQVEMSELVYGQSFQFVEIKYDETILHNILHQLHIMEANIYMERFTDDFVKYKNMIFPKINKIKLIKLTDDIIHIAKSPHIEIDIYSDYITKDYNYNWKVETWQRGHNINQRTTNLIDIKSIKYEHFEFTESQDHSKWATSDNDYYWVGDLNRMTSQYKRGGGGFICKDKNLASCLNKLIMS